MKTAAICLSLVGAAAAFAPATTMVRAELALCGRIHLEMSWEAILDETKCRVMSTIKNSQNK